MHEERLLSVGVECYAGHRGEQTPRTLILGEQRVAVAEVMDAWLAPGYRYFKFNPSTVLRETSGLVEYGCGDGQQHQKRNRCPHRCSPSQLFDS